MDDILEAMARYQRAQALTKLCERRGDGLSDVAGFMSGLSTASPEKARARISAAIKIENDALATVVSLLDAQIGEDG